MAASLAVGCMLVDARIARAQTGTVTGTVTSEATGTPLSSVTVELYSLTIGWCAAHPCWALYSFSGATLTDALGVYAFSVQPTGGSPWAGSTGPHYIVRTRGTGAAGFVDEVYNNVPCLSDCGDWNTYNSCLCASLSVAAGATVQADFALSTGVRIGGRVTNAATGSPIAGATVRFFKQVSPTYIDFAPKAAATALTDSDGFYVSPPLATGGYFVQTNVDGMVDQTWPRTVPLSQPLVDHIDFALQPGSDDGSRISGVVTAAMTGAPVANVTVTFHQVNYSGVTAFPSATVSTDAGGFYSATLQGGFYYVVRTKGAASSALIDLLYPDIPCLNLCEYLYNRGGAVPVLPFATNAKVDLALPPGGRVSGVATHALTGLPVPGLAIAFIAHGGIAGIFAEVASATTDENGAYLSPWLPTRLYDLETRNASDLGLLNQTRELVAVTAPATTTGIDFPLSPGAHISGKLTHALTGAPLNAVTVRFVGNTIYGVVKTNAQGEYSTPGLPSGPYFLFTETVESSALSNQAYKGHECGNACYGVVWGDPVWVTAPAVVSDIDFALRPLPANDSFTTATVWTHFPVELHADIRGATVTSTDPTPACGGGGREDSVWYSFTPAVRGILTIDTIGSSYDTVVSVYTGIVGSFVSVGCDDDGGGAKTSRVSLRVIPGVRYLIMVSDHQGAPGGELSLHAAFRTPAPIGSFTGDGHTDLGVFDPTNGFWYVTGRPPQQWGDPGDVPVPGDYDGDGKTEVAVWRPSNGLWYLGAGRVESWGVSGDVPVPGDYDGDGQTDIAVFRPGTSTWWILGQGAGIAWGQVGDIPVPADHDGDGRVDIAVWRPSTGMWYVRNGASVKWGEAGDVPVPADYNGDGAADMAVYRPSTTAGGPTWWVHGVGNWAIGAPDFLPIPQDLDGDGDAELVLYNPTTGDYYNYFWRSNRWSTSTFSRGQVPILLPTGLRRPAAGDADGDGARDLTVFSPAVGMWWIRPSSGAAPRGIVSGTSTDEAVPGDYDGDGRLDPAVFRASTGSWLIPMSSSDYLTVNVVQWGAPGDVPVAADFDGDHRTDITVYRPSNGTWWTLLSTTEFATYRSWTWGLSTDVPISGDFDGDGRTDITVFRPSDASWWSLLSSTDYTTDQRWDWGQAGDRPVVADYDGDRRSDIAVYRPSQGYWYLLYSSSGFAESRSIEWGGGTGYQLVPGDYDGDGRADVAVFEPNAAVWYISLSSTNYTTSWALQWGSAGDIAVPR